MDDNLAEIQAFVQKSLTSATSVASNNTTKQGVGFPRRLNFSELQRLIDKFGEGNRDERWVVMLGMRGVGKTTMLFQSYRYLTETKGVRPEDVLCLSMRDAMGKLGAGINELVEGYESQRGERLITTKSRVYLLIDEAHHDEKWAATIKEIYEKAPNVFFLVTGSSALSLQSDGDLEADKARRINWLHVGPLKFTEYLLLNGRQDYDSLSRDLSAVLFGSADAHQVMAGLTGLKQQLFSFRTECEEMEIRRYLTQGSFPYAMGLQPIEAFGRITRTTDDVIDKDVKAVKGVSFSMESLRLFPRLLTFLATWNETSQKKLAEAVGTSPVLLVQMIDALIKCELIIAVKSYGGVKVKETRPPRYAFGSTNVKAAYRWSIGMAVTQPSQFGVLLEDLLIQYFETDSLRRLASVYRREGEGEADFVLETPLGERIVCEVSFGPKTSAQVRKTMATVEAKYGLVFSNNEPAISDDGRIVIVPMAYLLAC